VAIYWDPTDEATVVEEDRQLLAFYRDIEGPTPKIQQKWLLRLELNREEMYNKNISMADVVFVIQQLYPTDVGIIYSDYNADKLVLRIRMISEDDREKDTAAQLDDFTILKRFQNKLLNQCVIRGVPGIKAVTFRNDVQTVALEGEEELYKPLKQYILDTDGTNYVKVMNHPSVDATKLYTTNVYDILDILGLEAARAILLNELQPIFGSVGVNIRHMGILCDWITRTGRLMSIDRNGINKNDIGPLAKMSFEETSKIVLKAALFGEVDPVTGVSANIMTGQPFRGGTAFSQILLDDTVFEQFTNDLEAVPEEETEVDGNVLELMTRAVNDPCAQSHFQTNLVLPERAGGLEEPDVELYDADEA
jgi:DNA-directed RNA polymerase II subunit RPB1